MQLIKILSAGAVLIGVLAISCSENGTVVEPNNDPLISVSKLSSCRPYAFLSTETSINPYFDKRINPAQVPKTGIPDLTRETISLSKPLRDKSFCNVVDSPPGITNASTKTNSFPVRTSEPYAPNFFKTERCSEISPCSASTPIFTLPPTFFKFYRKHFNLFPRHCFTQSCGNFS